MFVFSGKSVALSDKKFFIADLAVERAVPWGRRAGKVLGRGKGAGLKKCGGLCERDGQKRKYALRKQVCPLKQICLRSTAEPEKNKSLTRSWSSLSLISILESWKYLGSKMTDLQQSAERKKKGMPN
jgi:hypothetical protein